MTPGCIQQSALPVTLSEHPWWFSDASLFDRLGSLFG
jgi:hypothetical protein